MGGAAHDHIYLPAMERYDGRFYRSLGDARREQLQNPRHHVVVVSGLYGLVNPGESIQLYSLHVPDHPKIKRIWRKEGVLTRVLRSYIGEHGITRVFELCGTECYRLLVDWDALGAEVLHAFGNMNAGDALLSALGGAARELLRYDEEELLTMPPGHTMKVGETVVLTHLRQPPEGYPREQLAADNESWNESNTSERRGVAVESGDHRTIFGHRVSELQDVPARARELLGSVTRAQDVLRVHLGRFSHQGKTAQYQLRLYAPTKGSGVIRAELHGPGKIGGTQEVEIVVRPGQESVAYQAIHIQNTEIQLT